MNQTTIDFTQRPRPPRVLRVSAPASHLDDPQSSKEAEERVTRSGHRHTNAETVLRVLASFGYPATAAEIATITEFDAVEVRRRLHDLHGAGLVRQCGKRPCSVATTSATMWAPELAGLELVARMGS